MSTTTLNAGTQSPENEKKEKKRRVREIDQPPTPELRFPGRTKPESRLHKRLSSSNVPTRNHVQQPATPDTPDTTSFRTTTEQSPTTPTTTMATYDFFSPPPGSPSTTMSGGDALSRYQAYLTTLVDMLWQRTDGETEENRLDDKNDNDDAIGMETKMRGRRLIEGEEQQWDSAEGGKEDISSSRPQLPPPPPQSPMEPLSKDDRPSTTTKQTRRTAARIVADEQEKDQEEERGREARRSLRGRNT